MKTSAPDSRNLLLSVTVASLALLAPVGALADDKLACLSAAQKGQRARDTHKLVDARASFRVCAAATCPAVVQSDCAGWLAEVEKALPTVVLAAKSRADVDLIDVKVSVDGQLLATKVDGHALPLDPGPHSFRFEGATGEPLERAFVVKEGEKNQPIAVVLGPLPATPAPTQSTAPPPSSSLRTAGWILGGVGVGGLAAGGLFGGLGLSAKGADCNGDVCKPGSTSGIKTDALVADIGFIAGGVALAGGAGILLFGANAGAGGGGGHPASAVIAPTFGAGSVGLVSRGTF